MRSLVIAFVAFILIVVASVVGSIVSDTVSEFRSSTTVLNVGTDSDGFLTLSESNSLLSSGMGYEIYIVSAQVDPEDSYISSRNPDIFSLELIINDASSWGIAPVTYMHMSDEKYPDGYKTLNEAICAPAGYTTAAQVIEYDNQRYSPISGVVYADDHIVKPGKYTLNCR